MNDTYNFRLISLTEIQCMYARDRTWFVASVAFHDLWYIN